jgi:hypothetical protein
MLQLFYISGCLSGEGAQSFAAADGDVAPAILFAETLCDRSG